MKRVLLPLFLFLAMATQFKLNAQVIVFQEDFDGIGASTAGGVGTYAFPAGWLLASVDNRIPAANVNYVNDAWERREDFANNTADSCAFSTSWYTPAGAADDWMWTPAINVPAGPASTLTWNAVTYDASFPDGYEVRVMVAPNVPTGSNGAVGNMVTASTQIFSIAAETTTWSARTASLAAYAGQTIRIAFRNTSNDMFLLLIDDVTVTQPIANDIQLVSTSPVSQYTLMPESQTTPLTLAGTISNVGSSAATNVRLQATVLRDGIQVYQASSASVANLAPLASSGLLTVAPYTPTTAGTYVVNFQALMTATDQIAANNTASQTRTVERYAYARDNGVVSGAVGIGAGNGGHLGNEYDLPNAGRVGSVSIYYSQGYTGQPHGVAVFDMVSGTPVNLIHTTSPATYLDDSARLYTVPFPSNINLASGQYLFAAIEYDSTVQVGQTNDIFTAGTAWVNWPTTPLGGWGNIEAFGANFAKAFVIRPNFCPNRTLNLTTTDVLCGQPNSGTATASIANLETPLSYTWSNGSTMTSITGLAAGTYTCTVTDALYCAYTASVNVVAQVPPTATISGNNTICAGANTTLTASGGTSYIWSNGANTAANTLSMAGTYTVTVTAANGCTASATSTLTVNPIPSINITGQTAVCAGNTSMLSAQGASSYLWSTGAATASITVSVAGTYTVTATSAAGCTATASSSLTVNANPAVTFTGSTIICAGTTSLLTAAGGASYSWSTGANTPDITVSTAGNYGVTATSAAGCTASASTDIQVIALPTPVITVSGNTLSTPSNVGSTYQWFFNGNILAGEVSNTHTGTQAGNYTVVETNAQACNQISTAVSFVPVGLNTVYVLSLSVYPNPVQDVLNVVGFENTSFDYSVFNTMGQVVAKGNAYNQVNVAQLPAGCYVLRLHTNTHDNTYQTTFIKD